MSNRLQTALAAAAVLALTSGAAFASATNFEGTFSVIANTGDPGLVINTSPNSAFGGSNNVNFSLSAGNSTGFQNLFNISTPETTVNNDDTVQKPISVEFSFSEPSPPFAGSGTGTTVGQSFFYGVYQDGKLTWDNNGVFDINYPGGGNGVLQVALTGGTFNGGYFGLDNSWCDGLTVQANFTDVSDPTNVPEPAGIAMFGVGLLGLGMIGLRRRAVSGSAA